MTRTVFLLSSVIALGVFAAACGERSAPLSPLDPSLAPTGPIQPASLQAFDCRVNVAARTLSCATESPLGGANRDIVVGGQNVYVALVSSNPTYVGTTLSTDVAVQNLIRQTMGTNDGTTPDATGVRVFFQQQPTVTSGSGVVTVVNADGTGTFTGANQAYFQYIGAQLGGDNILQQNETSGAKPWQFELPASVATFEFKLYVSANVRWPLGFIDVTPATAMITAGSTLPLAAVVRSAIGDPTASQAVTWASNQPASATVDANGMVTAVAVGHSTVTATSGARTGSAALTVCPNLAVGDVFTFASADVAGLCVSGYASDAEYTMLPMNQATSALAVTVTGTGIQAVTGPPSPNLIPTGGANLLRLADDAGVRERYEDAMHAREARSLPSLATARAGRNARRMSSVGFGARSRGASRGIIAGVVPAVGDTMSLNVAQGCSGTPDMRRAVVKSVSAHLIIVADTSNPAGGFSLASYDSIAAEFDTIAYPAVVETFGATTDEDNNGHVVAFYTRSVNELSPPASSSVTLGYFTSRDIFGVTDCTLSNEGEMFYMLVPDPTGVVNSNVRTNSFVRGSTVGTLGHEFQHLVNGWRRAYVTGASFFEEGVLNEGLSHITEELMFYRMAAGLTPKQNIALSALTTGPTASRRVAAFNSYANQNFGRLRPWLQRPDTAGIFKSGAQNSLAVRGGIWAFLRYAADRMNGGDYAFFSTLVNSNLEGQANIQNAIGGADPKAWLRDWQVAMYGDDNAFAVAQKYQTQSWNFRSVYSGIGGFVLLARPLTNGVPLTLSTSAGGGTSFDRFGVPANGHASFTVTGAGGATITSPFALTLLRTK